MRAELRKQPRDIVYSLCQYGNDKVWEWGAQVDGQTWRTTGDINDSWRSMSNIGFGQDGHEKFAGPGRWNDPDMLVVGYVGWGPNIRPTRLTPDEQYTHVSLWSLLASPLLIGCDLTKLDPFTLGLLTNDEVIEVNQDPLGKQARKVADNGDHEVWAKPLEDGGIAVGLFNRSGAAAKVTVNFADLGLNGEAGRDVRDLWRQESLGASTSSFTSEVASHGVRFVKIKP
jgi:alpha-galactosidase